jgi:hypothetical protein
MKISKRNRESSARRPKEKSQRAKVVGLHPKLTPRPAAIEIDGSVPHICIEEEPTDIDDHLRIRVVFQQCSVVLTSVIYPM